MAAASGLVHRMHHNRAVRGVESSSSNAAINATSTNNRSRSPNRPVPPVLPLRVGSSLPESTSPQCRTRRRRLTRRNWSVNTKPGWLKRLVYLLLIVPCIIFVVLGGTYLLTSNWDISFLISRRLLGFGGGRTTTVTRVPRQEAVLLATRGEGHVVPPRRVDMITFPDYGHESDEATVLGTPIEIQHGPDDKRLFAFGPEDDESLLENEYYAFDDDTNRNTYVWKHDDALKTYHCRRNSFYRDVFPNCNEFHATDFASRALKDETRFIGGGSYRNVFLHSADHSNPEVIMKMGEINMNFTIKNYEFMRMEGTTNAILAPHPLVVNMYGFCSFSMFSEAVMGGDIDEKAVPIYDRHKHCEKTFDEEQLLQLNELHPTTKLEWALDMAEAVALLHNHERGVMVHDDIQLVQFLLDKDGHLKMNDFNRAEFMLYDKEHHHYCKYENGPGNGDWRSPEEYMDLPLDEKIDIWSLGLNMYAVLTGLVPIYDACSTSEAQTRIMHGEKIYIPEQYFKKSFAEGKLAEIIQGCFVYEPKDRISVNEVVLKLRAAVEENHKLHTLARHKRQFARV